MNRDKMSRKSRMFNLTRDKRRRQSRCKMWNVYFHYILTPSKGGYFAGIDWGVDANAYFSSVEIVDESSLFLQGG
jgi:hypothetical protein